jgi:hypothetical protein
MKRRPFSLPRSPSRTHTLSPSPQPFENHHTSSKMAMLARANTVQVFAAKKATKVRSYAPAISFVLGREDGVGIERPVTSPRARATSARARATPARAARCPGACTRLWPSERARSGGLHARAPSALEPSPRFGGDDPPPRKAGEINCSPARAPESGPPGPAHPVRSSTATLVSLAQRADPRSAGPRDLARASTDP